MKKPVTNVELDIIDFLSDPDDYIEAKEVDALFGCTCEQANCRKCKRSEAEWAVIFDVNTPFEERQAKLARMGV